MHTFEIYLEPADTDEPRRLLGTINADTMAQALHKASQYFEIPSHDLETKPMTFEEVHAALLALNEARLKTINQLENWADPQASAEQWQRIRNLDERIEAIEQAVPMFRVWFDDHEHDSYVLIPRAVYPSLLQTEGSNQ